MEDITLILEHGPSAVEVMDKILLEAEVLELKANQKTEEVDAVFLAPWPLVETIMHYPHREGFDFPSEFDKHIGFISKDNEK